MSEAPTLRSHLTLGLCTILHAFTHAYTSMLVPLYLIMVVDLKLGGVGAASLVVTVYSALYCLGSYGAGVLADRFDRKLLLAIGLVGNALAIIAIGISRDYWMIVGLGAVAGCFGTLFHPAANALASSLYPKSPGMAIGILGAGSGMGFFFGPQIAGWRAHAAVWHFANVGQWQRPCVEMGIAGLFVGLVFLVLGADPKVVAPIRKTVALDSMIKRRTLQIALSLMFRDFCAVAVISLASIYLQKVFRTDVQSTGLAVGLMMLPSVLANPFLVYLSDGRRRLPALAMILMAGACVVITTPLWGAAMALPILCIYQTLQMGSYAVSDAAMLERVDPEIRGRVVGLFLLVAGGFSSLGPWVMGRWTDWLGPRASERSGYFGPFGLLALFMLLAASSPIFLARLGEPISRITPEEEISPATIG